MFVQTANSINQKQKLLSVCNCFICFVFGTVSWLLATILLVWLIEWMTVSSGGDIYLAQFGVLLVTNAMNIALLMAIGAILGPGLRRSRFDRTHWVVLGMMTGLVIVYAPAYWQTGYDWYAGPMMLANLVAKFLGIG